MSTVVITGANRGIGLEFCRQLHARGDSVIAVCRQASSGLEELGVRLESGIEVTDDATIHTLAEHLEGERVDLLINNAGILEADDLDSLDFESARRQIDVNALGALRVTRALLPHMGKGAKVAVITSLMGSMGDNTSGRMYGYRMSKAALNSAAVSLARDLEPRGIAVGILHPGFVRTEMTGGRGNLEVTETVVELLARLDELTIEASGQLHDRMGKDLPW